jgi:hypothetical protein
MPMRPEEIEELMHGMNQQTIACTVPAADEAIPKLTEGEL